MKNNKSPEIAVQKRLQLIFIYSVIISFFMVLEPPVRFAITQIPTNSNLSGFYITFLMLGLVPVSFFIVAYLLNTRKMIPRQRVFESLLVSVIGSSIVNAANSFITDVLYITKLPFGDIFGSFSIPTFISVTVFTLILLYLLSLRRTGRW